MPRTIRRALLSVSDKTGIVEFAAFLRKCGVEIISTGGTARELRKHGVDVFDVSQVSGYPEIMDGRVKTLHPYIHAGILGKRNAKGHLVATRNEEWIGTHEMRPIDMVVVNLYPFEKVVAMGADFDTCIDTIDIGGPAMIRSAAKNHRDVAVIVDPEDYAPVKKEMKKSGSTTLSLRKKLATKAFVRTAAYDAAISRWFMGQSGEVFPDTARFTFVKKQSLRYGENPHQRAALYADGGKTPGVARAEQIQGKALSYNNIADTDAALELVSEFGAPAVAIIKHANPCGAACAETLSEAYRKALAADPVSAYGSIIACNRPVDAKISELLSHLFVEVLIAPAIDEEAKHFLAKKKNLRVLITGAMPDRKRRDTTVKSVAGGVLIQERDFESLAKKDLKVVTKRKPTKQEMSDLLFAWQVCKHVKSNAIVLAKDACTIGVGAGQMSRVDAVRLALQKAKDTATQVKDAKGSVIASDAFFPFADGLELAAKAGVTACIQPGGSVRDEEVIETANRYGMAMVFTGKRHFRH